MSVQTDEEKEGMTSYFCPQKKDKNDEAAAERELDRDAEMCQKAERASELWSD